MMFDLETLFNHLKNHHQIKVKEYIDLYIGPIGTLQQQIQPTVVDTDGAPVKAKRKYTKRSLPLTRDDVDRPIKPKPKAKAGPAPKPKKMALDSWLPGKEKSYTRGPASGRVSDPSAFNTGTSEML